MSPRERAHHVEQALVTIAGRPDARASYHAVDEAWSAYSAILAARETSGSPAERWRRGAAAYAASPLAALAHARELDGADLQGDGDLPIAEAVLRSPSLADAVYRGKYPTLLAVEMLEWACRLELTRLAVAWLLAAPADAGAHSPSLLALGECMPDTPRLAIVPNAIESAIFDWGGFFKEDESEFGLVASRVGIAQHDFTAALTAIDALFPLRDGESWWKPVEGIRWLGLVPFPVQGLGAICRDEVDPDWENGLSSVAKRYISIRRAAAVAYL